MTARFRITALVFAICLAALSAAPFHGAAEQSRLGPEPPGTSPEIDELVGKAAGELLFLAEELIEQGYPTSATRALEICLGLDREIPGARSIKEKLVALKQAYPAPAAQINLTTHSCNLFDGKSFRGWKKNRGKWEATSLGIRCETSRTGAVLTPIKTPEECRGFVLAFSFKIEPDSEIGVVCGRSGRSKTGILFKKSGAELHDFKESSPLGSGSRRGFPPNRFIETVITVDGDKASVAVRGKEIVAGTLDDFTAGEIEFQILGTAFLDRIVFTPTEFDVAMKQGREAMKKGDDRKAASLFLRALAVVPDAALTSGLLAGVMEDLRFGDAAARHAGDFLRPGGTGRSHDSEIRRLHRSAEKIAARAEEATGRVGEIAAAWADRFALACEQALEQKEVAKARLAHQALVVLETRGEVKEDFRVRTFLAGQEDGKEKKLFNGTDLSGWKIEAGEWIVEEGTIRAQTGEGEKKLVLGSLPPFDRYLLKTRQKGSGSYIDQGIRFFVGGETFSLRLYRFMKKREITLHRGDLPVYYYPVPEDALTSTRWHAVDCLVHMNRLTVILDGNPLFTKILPAPPEPRICLYATAGRRCSFSGLLFRPIGVAGEYEALLHRMGVPLSEVVECETLKEGETIVRGRVREQPFAYSGRSLTDTLHTSDKNGIGFRFKTTALPDAVLSLRYAAVPRRRGAPSPEGTRLAVSIDGRKMGDDLHLPPTPSINDFAYAAVTVGDLAWGWHEVRLKSLAVAGNVVLDRIELSCPDAAPKEETKIYDTPLAPHFRIRLSPGVQLPENAEEIFALLETLRQYMVHHYGFEPADPLFYNLISRECWGDPHKGGYATGDNLYVPEETTARGLATIMHEMSHNFDVGQGFNPPWFGEGKSFPIFLKFSRETGIQYREFQNPLSRQSPVAGEEAYVALEVNGENLLQYWGTPRFPYWGKLSDGRDLTSLGYRASNWFCRKLSDHLGETWLRDYFTLLRKEIEEKIFYMPRDRVEANSVIVDYFTRSSKKNVTSFFVKKGFRVIDIYDWEELSLPCGEGEEKFLSHAGPSRVGPAPDGDGRCRFLEEGELFYSFPVPPDTRRLTVTITFGGYGICDAWDRRLFRKKARGDWEERTIRLDNPKLWAGSRFRLTFAPEKAGSRTLLLKKITIKKD